MTGESTLTGSTYDISRLETLVFSGGDGAPLFLLHGEDYFAPDDTFIRLLSQHRRVIVPSHPGFGPSVLPDWIDNVEDIAHLYIALLDRLDLREVDVVGCSIGGWIAAEMATRSLDLIRKLALVGPVGVKTGPIDRLDVPDIFAMSQQKLDGLLYHDPSSARIDPATMTDEQLATLARNRETLALLTWEPYMHNTKLRHRLANSKCPALLLRGESDGLISAEYLAAYAGLFPDARTLTIPQAGHLPHREQPERLASAILAFLEN